MKKFIFFALCFGISILALTQSAPFETYKTFENIQSDPFLLDENISNTTLAFGQRFPKVAFDGNIYLVAWRDFRTQSSQNADVYACRVDEDGNPLDPGGIPICTAQRNQAPVDVIYDGTNFVVVWFDEREQGQTEVYFARVTSSGEVLDPDGIQATSGINMVSWNTPCAGTGNGITLIAWCEDMVTGAHAVKCKRIDTSGNILDPDGFIVSDTLNDDSGEMAIGYDGTNFLVVWESGMYSFDDDIRGTRVSQSGDVLDPGGFTIAYNPEDQLTPAVSFGANKFLVTWSDDQGEDEDIYGTFVTTDGIVADSSGFVISSALNDQETPCITFDGTNFIVAWTDRRFDWDVYATAVTPDGDVLGPDGWGVGAWQNTITMYCDITTGADYILVVWENKKFTLEEDVQGGRITIDEYLMPDSDGFDIGVGPYSHANPDVSFDGTNYFAVWEDFRNGIAQVYGTRISPGGELLDPDGIYIGSNDTMRVQFPRITYNGTNYVVVWNFQTSDGYSGGGAMARVSTDGVLIDDQPITIIDNNEFNWNFTVCSDGNNALIAWNAYNATSYDIFGAIAQQDGTVGLPFIICDADDYQEFPSLAFNGTNYLAVWEDSRGSSKDIYGTLISPEGIVLNPDGIEISNEQSRDNRPSVASNANNFMVSWYSGNSAGESIYGAIIDQSGNVTVGQSLIYESSTFEFAQHSDVTFNGTNYILSWQTFTSAEQDYNIMGTSVDAFGSVSQIITIDDSDGNQFEPHLAAGNSGQVLALYDGYTAEISGQTVLTYRSYGIFVDELIGIEEIGDSELDFEIFPNPTAGEFRVRSLEFRVSQAALQLFGVDGRMLLEKTITAGIEEVKINVRSLQSGLYFCRITVGNKSVTKKLVIK